MILDGQKQRKTDIILLINYSKAIENGRENRQTYADKKRHRGGDVGGDSKERMSFLPIFYEIIIYLTETTWQTVRIGDSEGTRGRRNQRQREPEAE